MIDIELVKTHLKIDEDFYEGDPYIQHLIDTAIEEFELGCNRTLVAEGDALPDPVGNALNINASITHGALMLISHYYNNRDSVIIGVGAVELPLSTQRSWKKHRWINI